MASRSKDHSELQDRPTILDLTLTTETIKQHVHNKSLRRSEVKFLLDSYGISRKDATSKKQLERRLLKAHTQAVIYEGFSHHDLETFVHARNLSPLPRSTLPATRYKEVLVALLEQADKDLTFPFLDLPPELRNMIYELALVPSLLVLCSLSFLATSPPSLTQSCKQVRQEALPVYYRNNVFPIYVESRSHVDSSLQGTIQVQQPLKVDSNSWMRTIDIEYFKNIRSFQIIEPPPEHYGAHPDRDASRLVLDFNFDRGNYIIRNLQEANSRQCCLTRVIAGVPCRSHFFGVNHRISSQAEALLCRELAICGKDGLAPSAMLRVAAQLSELGWYEAFDYTF